jgi:hypothetical protein
MHKSGPCRSIARKRSEAVCVFQVVSLLKISTFRVGLIRVFAVRAIICGACNVTSEYIHLQIKHGQAMWITCSFEIMFQMKENWRRN